MTSQSGAVAFRRVVIRFCDTFGSVSSLEAAAGLARTLESELVGIFIEDEELLEWSSSPFARQIPRPGSAAAPAAATGTQQDLAAAVSNIRRRFMRAATSFGLRTRFEVERASAVSLEMPGAGPDDLLVVIEPSDPLARQSYPFTAILEAVIRYSGPVLYIPRNVGQRPIAAVVQMKDASEPVRDIAGNIAARLGVKVSGPDDISHQQGRRGQHLIVFDRGKLQNERDFQFAAIAAEYRAPVLIVGSRPAT